MKARRGARKPAVKSASVYGYPWAIQAAAVPGGGPTLSSGVKALMRLEAEGSL